ncbi:PAS domain-containing sensor histidine kinase [Nitrospira sp. Nam74]
MSKTKKVIPKPSTHKNGQGYQEPAETSRRVPLHRPPGLPAPDNSILRRSSRPPGSSREFGTDGQLQAILDHSPNLIFVKDTAGRYLFVNRRFEEIFHLTREYILHKTDDELFSPPQATAFRSNDRKVLDAGVPLEFEEAALHDDGVHTSIVFKFPLCDEDGRPYAIGGITTDITDRKRIEEALRDSQARLALAFEERQRLDADLHDNIIQMAYAIGMGIEQSRLLLKQDATVADDTLKTALAHLNQVIADVRSYIQRQKPLRLQGNRLIATLANFIQSLHGTHGVHFTLEMDPSVAQQLTDEQSGHLYYVAHEAVSNCFRHANARCGRLSLQICGRSVRLKVEDDGRGFDSEDAMGRGHGLQNIRMRVRELDGHVQVESVPGRGTRIVADIPLHNQTRA